MEKKVFLFRQHPLFLVLFVIAPSSPPIDTHRRNYMYIPALRRLPSIHVIELAMLSPQGGGDLE